MNNEYVIFDMNSSNGTYVNNDRIVKKKLDEGDVIQLGVKQASSSFLKMKNPETYAYYIQTNNNERSNSLVDTLIEHELKQPTKIQMELYVTYGDGSKAKIELRQDEVFIEELQALANLIKILKSQEKHSLIKKNDTERFSSKTRVQQMVLFLMMRKLKVCTLKT